MPCMSWLVRAQRMLYKDIGSSSDARYGAESRMFRGRTTSKTMAHESACRCAFYFEPSRLVILDLESFRLLLILSSPHEELVLSWAGGMLPAKHGVPRRAASACAEKLAYIVQALLL